MNLDIQTILIIAAAAVVGIGLGIAITYLMLAKALKAKPPTLLKMLKNKLIF